MRVLIKGGIWKNSEDEVLKAAVMKYGLNQWARISSLLVRKSAKQCKARWFEWLDPSIKKIEWNREEDEKLLHCAKILPNQWRSIGPIVGRTPAQCLERYEYLLNQAAQQDGGYDPTNAKKLLPGDFATNAESRPAKPDPKDMDADEREMLSEARARLANTKGKKAKRKAREKQLQQARRLASLQKKRELRMAGIGLGERKRRRHWIDYNQEIPFHAKAPRGLHDTTADDRRARAITAAEKRNFERKYIEDIEGLRRDEVEAKEREKDKKRTKLWRKNNLPEVMAAEAALNDQEQISQRPTLALPQAQVTEREIETIAKLNQKAAIEDANTVTAQLVDGSNVSTARVEVRTPATNQNMMDEARYALELNNAKTPLLGGENPTPMDSDFSGMTPKSTAHRTPNTLMSKQQLVLADGRTPSAFTPGGITPGGITPGGITPGRTPGTPGDMLSINTPGRMKQTKRGKKRKRKEIKNAFDLLPKPHNDYEIVRPDVKPEEAPQQKAEDLMDIEARKEQARLQQREKEFKRQTKVIQRKLVRPKRITNFRTFPDDKNKFLAQAAEAIKEEMIALMQHDSEAFPADGKRPKKRRKYRRKEYQDGELRAASSLLKQEMDKVRVEVGESEIEDFQGFSEQCHQECLYIPSKERFDMLQNCTQRERLECARQQFALAREQLIAQMAKSQKLEKKTNVLIGGYLKIVNKAKQALSSGFADFVKTEREVEVFESLERAERIAIPKRLKEWRELVKVEKDREREVQSQYKYLLAEVQSLSTKIAKGER